MKQAQNSKSCHHISAKGNDGGDGAALLDWEDISDEVLFERRPEYNEIPNSVGMWGMHSRQREEEGPRKPRKLNDGCKITLLASFWQLLAHYSL